MDNDLINPTDSITMLCKKDTDAEPLFDVLNWLSHSTTMCEWRLYLCIP